MATQQVDDSETPAHQVSAAVDEKVTSEVQDPTDILKRRIANDYTAYEPISIEPGNEQFRLINILPAKNEEDEVVCVLLNHSLSTPDTPYIALSYCWGGLGEQRTIKLIHGSEASWEEETPGSKTRCYRVNGNTARPFNVTLALYSALKSIRNSQARNLTGSSFDVRHFIWVDAICINQENLPERNSQVGKMGSIYSGASFVWIWLGESEEIMEGLYLISWFIKPGTEWWPDEQALLNPNEHNLLTLLFALSEIPIGFSGAKGPEAAVRILEKLFSHPYWRRIWVLQEATIRAERTFIYTKHTMTPWPRLLAATRIVKVWREMELTRSEGQLSRIWTDLVKQRLSFAEGIPDHLTERDLPQDLGYALSLATLFFNTSGDFDATDLRDKVFALLDLSKELQGGKKFGSKLKPDYSKSISQVFIEFTKWLIHNRGASVLSYIGSGPRRVLPDNPVLGNGNDMPSGCLDATQYPSWAVWPATVTVAGTARDWRMTSLYQTPHGVEGGYDLASGAPDPNRNHLASSVWNKMPPSISDRLIGLGGKQMGVVKSILRLPLRLYLRPQPNWTKTISFKEDTTDGDVTDAKAQEAARTYSNISVSLSHPYLQSTPLQGALPFLWREIQKTQTDVLMFGDEIVETRKQEWLGREGGRYAGRPERMFRDFFETVLLYPVVRDDEADRAPDGDQIPGSLWNDPEVAAGFAMAWLEGAPAMEHMPARIGRRLKAVHGQRVPLEKTFHYLFKGSGRCFFITEDERMGMCGPDVNPGDIVVGLYGSAVPFVLRPLASEAPVPGENWSFSEDQGFRENIFRFMGDCYVHNRMSSSSFENVAEKDEERTFYLC